MHIKTPQPKNYYRIKEAAKLLGVSESSVYSALRSGGITYNGIKYPATKEPGVGWLIPCQALGLEPLKVEPQAYKGDPLDPVLPGMEKLRPSRNFTMGTYQIKPYGQEYGRITSDRSENVRGLPNSSASRRSA